MTCKIALVVAAGLAAGALVLACSGHGKSAKVPDTEGDPKRAAAFRDGGAEIGSHHFFLADVPDGAIGPHWARGEGGGLVAYIGPPLVDARAIVVVKVNKNGEATDKGVTPTMHTNAIVMAAINISATDDSARDSCANKPAECFHRVALNASAPRENPSIERMIPQSKVTARSPLNMRSSGGATRMVITTKPQLYCLRNLQARANTT